MKELTNRALKPIVMLICFVVLSGCASANLEIKVDIYDENPRSEPPLSEQGALLVLADLENLHRAASEERNLRVLLAQEAYDIFKQAWAQAGGAERPLSIETKDAKDAFIEVVNSNFTTFNQKVIETRAEIKKYIGSYTTEYEIAKLKVVAQGGTDNSDYTPKQGDEEIIRLLPFNLKKQEIALRLQLSATVSVYWQQRNSGTPYTIPWSALENRLQGAYVNVANNRNLQEIILSTAQRTRKQLQALSAVVAEHSGNERAARNQVSTLGSPGTLFNSAKALGIELETLRNDIPGNATSRAALSGLVQSSSRFFQLIDRLQDAGDPVWRIVSDPDNESHWKKGFSKTLFYAEGKAGVVVVRDNPMQYRIQHGFNQPGVLINAQLDVAQAVTSAALKIAGAKFGVPNTDSDDGDSSAGQPSAEIDNSFQQTKTDALEDRRRRQKALTTMNNTLSDLKDALANATSKEDVARAQRRLNSLLKSHKLIFELLVR